MTTELIFGRYEIAQRVAIGGMGEVFLARQHQPIERPVILKALLPDLAHRPEFVTQFLDEARVAATLNHPNIVALYEVGCWSGTYYLAMEFIDGQNLAHLLTLGEQRGKPMPAPVAARIVHDAARGLWHAHRAKDLAGQPLGIVHRDVSPQNLMVRRDGVTKVVDFGIARAANRETRTATGVVKGKLAYMSPEQAHGAEVDARADQFSLGVVCWEALARRRLFPGATDLEVIRQLSSGQLPSLKAVQPSTPELLIELTARMLATKPSERFADLGAVVAEFDAAPQLIASQADVAAWFASIAVEEPTATVKNFVIPLAPWLDQPTAQVTAATPQVVLPQMGPTTPQVRGGWVRAALDIVDHLPPEKSGAVLRLLPEGTEAALRSVGRLQFVPALFSAQLIEAIGRVMTPEEQHAYWQEAVVHAFGLPFLSSLTKGAMSLFRSSPMGLFRWAPRGFNYLYRNCGELSLEEVNPKQLFLHLHRFPVFLLGSAAWANSSIASYEAFFAYARAKGRVTVERYAPRQGEATFKVEWLE